MAETYRIYYSGTVYHPLSHLRRRKINSGEDVMLAGLRQKKLLKFVINHKNQDLKKAVLYGGGSFTA